VAQTADDLGREAGSDRARALVSGPIRIYDYAMSARHFFLLPLLATACSPNQEGGSDTSSTSDSASDDGGAPDGGDTGAGADPFDPLDALPACTPGEPGDELDIDAGCFDGVCLGHTIDEADEAYGEAGFCLAFGTSALCFWGDGILGSATDTDGDGVPDVGARLWAVQVLDPWAGANADGLMLGLGMGCFTDSLGPPDSLTFTLVDDQLIASAASWTDSYFAITDQQDASFALVPDGLVETISFQNALYQ
jgi:hypothetical protein